ncbi:hypothetical protein [Natrialba chahannaoensis]|nr:hypothetical protein [Natrialba chahannaoensis]
MIDSDNDSDKTELTARHSTLTSPTDSGRQRRLAIQPAREHGSPHPNGQVLELFRERDETAGEIVVQVLDSTLLFKLGENRVPVEEFQNSSDKTGSDQQEVRTTDTSSDQQREF